MIDYNHPLSNHKSPASPSLILFTRIALGVALSLALTSPEAAHAFGSAPQREGFIPRAEYESAKASHVNSIRRANLGKAVRGSREKKFYSDVSHSHASTEPHAAQLVATLERDARTASVLVKNPELIQNDDPDFPFTAPLFAFPDEESFQAEVLYQRPPYYGVSVEPAQRQLRQAPPLFDRLQDLCQALGFPSVYFDSSGEPEYVKSSPAVPISMFKLERGVGTEWNARTYDVENEYMFDRTVPFQCWDKSCNYVRKSSGPTGFESMTIHAFYIEQVRCSEHSPERLPDSHTSPVIIPGYADQVDLSSFPRGSMVLKGQVSGGIYIYGVRIPHWIEQTGSVLFHNATGTITRGFTSPW